jgi:hypothetical protein
MMQSIPPRRARAIAIAAAQDERGKVRAQISLFAAGAIALAVAAVFAVIF